MYYPPLTEYDEAEARELFRREGYEEGYEEGIALGRAEAMESCLRNLVATLGLSARQAMDVLDVPEAKRAHLLSML